ncbi:MAG: ABC transporter permease [Streptomycetales bacterium]
MILYVAKRLLHALFVVVAVATVVFFIAHLIPGDPVQAILGPESSGQAAANVRRRLGLDQPLGIQYLSYLKGAVTLDLGQSFFTDEPVARAIADAFPRTMSLTVVAFLFGIFTAIPLGIIAAVRRYRWQDNVASVVAFLGISMPSFWFGILLIIVFSVQLRWLPSFGYEPLSAGFVPWLSRLALPAIALGLLYGAIVTRITRGSMIEVLGQPYIRTARAKGMRESVILVKHALPNALIPIVTVGSIQLALLLSGAVVIETVFAIQGLGRELVGAVISRDYPLIQGTVLLISVVFVLTNLVTDILYAVINPRIRLEGGE